MSARRVAESGFSLPPNPSYIDFPRTDGNASTWPPNTARIVDHEGHVNFYAHVELDHHQNKKWRVSVGDAISLKLKMPDGPDYVLRDFPVGYRLFDHHKGPASAPRHDLYLFGPMKKRFRSINEFIPHAIWLMGDPTMDCECKYCAKKSQREVTASISNILRTTPTQSPGPGPSRTKTARDRGKGRDPTARVKEARQRDTRVYAAVQRTVQPLKPSPHVSRQPMLVERSNDLRGVFSKASMKTPRWFREGEVVWCALDPPISSDNDVAIEYWPAIIDEIGLKSQPVPRNQSDNADSILDTPRASTSAMLHNFAPDPNERGPMLDSTAELLPWKTQQSMRYKVHFLAISHSITVDNASILPYQAYMPPSEVIQLLTEFPVEKLNFDKALLAKFNPSPMSGPVSIMEAVPPFAVALQIASSLSSYWCLTDDYEMKYQVPPLPNPPAPASVPASTSVSTHRPLAPQIPPPQTLQEAIEAASRHNAQLSKASKSYYESISAVNGESSSTAHKRNAAHVLGVLPSTEQLSQTRFQGLWWGAERIWADDFIRLKIPRRTLAPNGDNHILPPAGPGKSSLEGWVQAGRDITELGAGMRGVFLRLNGIMAVDVPTANGLKKEARVCGMLYELADSDWVDPNEQSSISRAISQPSYAQNSSLAGPSNILSASQDAVRSTVGATPNTPTSGPPMEMNIPLAPEGYKFRAMLEPGYEFVGAMGLISGRYYPRVLTHPLVLPIVLQALKNTTDIVESNNLWALEGLSGGYFNSVDPFRYKKSRVVMLQDAGKEAIAELERYKEGRLAEQASHAQPVNQAAEDADAMDVDDIY